MNTKEMVYMVTYLDDTNKKHLTFVKGFSAVKFLEDRFSSVYFELAGGDENLTTPSEEYFWA